jgi:hypothetical protein
MTPDITIGTLIYRSMTYAKSVYESLVEFTPHLHDGRAELLYVVNDPEPGFYDRFREWADALNPAPRYRLLTNPTRSREWLFERGYGAPEYIHRVYRAWNACVVDAWGDTCVLVNSDHLFSPRWLECLLAHLNHNDRRLVCCQAVDVDGFNGCYQVEFGRSPATFDKAGFLKFVEQHRQPGVCRPGGVYMPVAFRRKYAIEAGLYPEGNLCAGRFRRISQFGDAAFFDRMQERLGIEHCTAMDSIVFHIREGEMKE